MLQLLWKKAMSHFYTDCFLHFEVKEKQKQHRPNPVNAISLNSSIEEQLMAIPKQTYSTNLLARQTPEQDRSLSPKPRQTPAFAASRHPPVGIPQGDGTCQGERRAWGNVERACHGLQRPSFLSISRTVDANASISCDDFQEKCCHESDKMTDCHLIHFSERQSSAFILSIRII